MIEGQAQNFKVLHALVLTSDEIYMNALCKYKRDTKGV